MKRILSSFLILCCLIVMCSCDDTEEVVDTRSLEEIMTEQISKTDYQCEDITASRLNKLNAYLNDHNLSEEFVPKELVRIWNPHIVEENDKYNEIYNKYGQYLSLNGFDEFCPIYIYSFEGKSEVEKLKDYLVSHTLSYFFSDQDKNISYKYAVSNNYLFITRFTELVSNEIIEKFSLSFESGNVSNADEIQTTFLVSGSIYNSLLKDKFDFKTINTYEEYQSFKEEMTNYEKDCKESYNAIFNWFDDQNKIYYSILDVLDLKIDEKTFEKNNILIIQIDLEIENYFPIVHPEFYVKGDVLEIRNMIECNMYDTVLPPLYMLYLIDNSLSFNEKEFTFYDYQTGLDWIPSRTLSK